MNSLRGAFDGGEVAVQGPDSRDRVSIADVTIALFLRARLLNVAVSFTGLRRALSKSFKC
jgi:hypothetical protein